MYVMHSVDKLALYESREHQRRHVVQVNHIAIGGGFADGPGGMIEVLQVVVDLAANRPLRVFVEPTGLHADGGFAIGVNHDIDTGILQPFRQLRDKEFGSTVFFRGNR